MMTADEVKRLEAELIGLLQDRELDEVVDFVISSAIPQGLDESSGEYAERIVRLSDALRRRALQYAAHAIERKPARVKLFSVKGDSELEEVRAICLYLKYLSCRK